MFNLINQVDKKTRLHFFVNEEYPGPGQFPVIIVKSVETGTGFQNTVLTKEEFASTLKNHYYKASLALMKSGEPILRFKPEGAVTQNYAEYLKDTHNFPIKDGEVAKPVNKIVYLSTESLAEQFPEIVGIVPKVETPKQVPTIPAQPTGARVDIQIPKLITVKVDLSILSISELNNVAKQLRQKTIDARQAEKEGKSVIGGSISIENDYQAVKKYITELTALGTTDTTNKALDNIESFETSKGSIYTVLPNGKTQRFKTAANELSEPNDLIVFVKFKNSKQEQDFLSAQNRQGGQKLYVVDSEGNLYDTNEQVQGKDVKLAIIKDGKVVETVETSLEPKVGYNTFDQRRFEKDGEKYRSSHLGNTIVKINYKKSVSAEPAVKSSGPSALQTLSILVFPRALDAISKSAVADAPQLSAVKTVGEEFYQMAINTVLADPSKLSTVYYPKLIKNNTGGTGASVYFELTPYDPTDPGALGSPFYIARVQIAEREKPVTLVLVKPKSPFGGKFGTPRFLAEIDLANPSEGKMSSTIPSAPVAPVAPVEPPVTKKARPVLTANTFEEPQAEVTSESPFLDSLQDEEELRAAAKEVKDACKGDLDDIA